MSTTEYEKLLSEIEKLKFHNMNLLTLIGLLNDDNMQQTTIQESIVMFDLSKNDVRQFTELVKKYDGNTIEFEKHALEINPVFSHNNIISILKSFVTSGMLLEKSNEIINSYNK